MFRRKTIMSLFLLLFACGGCNQDEILQKFAPPEDQARAIKYIEKMRHDDLAEIESLMVPELQTSDLHATLARMPGLLPTGEPTSRKLVGANLNRDNDGRSVNLTYQYGFAGNKWFLINCAVVERKGSIKIFGMQIQPLRGSLEEGSKFMLAGKSALQYTVLIAAILFLSASLFALIAAVLDQTLTRKWLWILCICFGVTQFTVNWSTGEWGFRPLSLNLFSVSAFSAPYSPWMISVGLPVGALIYIFRRLMNHRPAPVSKTIENSF